MKIQLTFFLLLLLFLISSCTSESNVPEAETENEEENKPIVFNIPDGFELEDLYAPKEANRGSWVALEEGKNGIMYACDQYGHIYTFPIPEVGEQLDTNSIELVEFPLGRANGLLWAFNSLYVVVNGRTNKDFLGSGVYRLTDTNEDDKLDHLEILLELDGSGEHGPHNMVVGPDGKSLYLLCGNHTKVPAEIKESRLPMNWGEDNLFPQYKDARGHASEIEAPGGWIAKTDPEGKEWELYSAGYRNPFDIAFNEAGELFTFDADMEWDLGMPWYRPVRVCHVTSGSEYGWRTGSGKWPVYYPDNLPPVINLGQGSPTGIFMGKGLNYPQKYQDGLFVMDWSFGTIYFVDLNEQGSTYTGTKEEFLSGTPLPLTDGIVGSDGNLYFATGGRRLESHLYRLRYTGPTDGPKAQPTKYEANELVALRKSLEAYHGVQDRRAVRLALKYLDHPDRFVRYAARLALEHQEVDSWAGKIFRSSDPAVVIPGIVAIARSDKKAYRDKALNKLQSFNLNKLPQNLQFDLLRAYDLVMIRLGKPSGPVLEATKVALSPHFPATDRFVNKELGRLLVFLDDSATTEKLVAVLENVTQEKEKDKALYLSGEVTDRSEQYGPAIKDLLENMPPADAIHHAISLANAKVGWTEELRKRYFNWYYEVFNSKGGMSFKGFMDNVRKDALDNIPEEQRAKFKELSGIYEPGMNLANLPQPKGPGKDYGPREISSILNKGLKDYEGSYEDGKLIYQAALCETCHRMRGEGGSAGPDLTQAHTRFSRWEMQYAIYIPSEEISDQYANNLYTMKDGSKYAGRLLEESETELKINPNPYDDTYSVNIPKADIVRTELSAISPMPLGLLNRLNEQEIVDLFAFLMAGGDKNHEIYTGEEAAE